MSLVIQGTTVGYMAGKLRMVDDSEPAALSFSFEELPDEIKSTLSETEVTADMLASGDRLMDLPLPDDELVVTVKRDGAFFPAKRGIPPHLSTNLPNPRQASLPPQRQTNKL